MPLKDTDRKFSIGDLVQLKSGGPKMTVNRLPEANNMPGFFDNDDRYHCVWFSGSKQNTGFFREETLEFYIEQKTKEK